LFGISITHEVVAIQKCQRNISQFWGVFAFHSLRLRSKRDFDIFQISNQFEQRCLDFANAIVEGALSWSHFGSPDPQPSFLKTPKVSL
jgi:hypothetical protein